MDPRIIKFAKILVDYSTNVKKGETVVISGEVEAKPLILELYRQVIKKGAYPRLHIGLPGTSYIYFKNASLEQLKKFPKIFDYEVKNSQVYISIISNSNTRELTNVDPKRIAIRQKVVQPIGDYIANRRDKIRRVTTLFPTKALAQEAEMSLEEYENFVYNAINIDWQKEAKKINKIKRLFKNADKIRILGKDTDITFSIKGRPAIADTDKVENMPSGEIFWAPLKKTVNGYISYTYPAIYGGREVNGIKLEFKNGKVVKATAEKNEKFLKQIIATDPGAKYLGEFGLGCNYHINKFTKEILFDEKIGGSIHLALGMAYKECNGKNKSAVHWDMIKDLKKDKGEIWVDDRLVQKNGKFIGL